MTEARLNDIDRKIAKYDYTSLKGRREAFGEGNSVKLFSYAYED